VESQTLTAVVLPVALGVIMLGLGLSLTLEDFRRVVRYPRAVVVALACQMLVLPAVCLALAIAFALPPELAVGLMLLAASPGGATANLFSHLAHGDVALNITLTAVNSVLSVATLPVIVNLSMAYFLGDARSIPLQLGKTLQVFAIVLVPVAIGMTIRARAAAFAARLGRPVKVLSIVFLVLVVVAAIAKEWRLLEAHAAQIAAAALAFNVASLLVGYAVPRLARIGKRQSIAIGMEIGIHNATLAIAIAMGPTLLASSKMAVPGAIYGILMFFTAAAFGVLVNRFHDEVTP
jgi:BASS family bile acid:Na+ symporter